MPSGVLPAVGFPSRRGGLNRQRNGYRMACKPPGYRQLRPPEGFQLELASRVPIAGVSALTDGPQLARADPGWLQCCLSCQFPLLLDTAEGMPWAALVLS